MFFLDCQDSSATSCIVFTQVLVYFKYLDVILSTSVDI